MKKNFLFSMLAVLLAWFWLGGVSMADNVAQIGNTPYTTLGAAFDAAWDGETITLLSDLTRSSSTINITDKTLTLDLDWHVINTSTSKLFTVNWWNLTVNNTSDTEWWVNSTAWSIFNVTAWNVTINAWTFTWKSTLIVAWENATAEVNDGTFVWYQNGNSTSVQAKHWAIVTINSWTFIAGQNPGDDKPQKVIYAWDDGNNCWKADQNYEIKWWTINVNGWYFEGRLSKSNSWTYNIIWWTFKVSQNKTAWVGCDYNVCDTLGSSEPNPPVYKWDPSSCKNFSWMAAMLNPWYIAVPTWEDWVYTVQAWQTVAVTFSTNGKTRNNVVYIKNGDTISEPAATKYSSGEAGEFDWYDENGVFNFNTPITSDITLYGKWKHTVSFDENWWVETINNQEIRDWGKVNKPTNPTKDGEVFAWWFNWDDAFDFGVALTNTDPLAITLTWRWEAMTASTWAAEDNTTYASWFVFEAEEWLSWADTQASVEAAVASNNSTAVMEWVAELVVYSDEDDDNNPSTGDVLLTWKVNFKNPVVVRIPVNSTGSVKVKVRHNGESTFGIEWLTTNSGATCTGWVASNPYDWSAIPVVWGYVEIYTCSASTFVAYTETANPAPSYGWWGGGGGSFYSCKNLPANAVANNTTKPKKNTNYSYSTDTGAVCTFQCKTGYTWNEKDAKCEKATETVADTNDTTVTENTENADTSDSASTEDLQKVLEDGYNVEFHNAYEFAFKNGITTMPTIEEADMNGNLNRIAMAKMLSQYAINVLGKTPDTTKEVPNFSDVDAQLDADYNNGVTLAYQLGIMWINIDEFRPFDLVTRAEFGTALSRMLFGIADGTELYYETHMQKLLEEKIITVANPDMHELRWYVMIMLMRSAKSE